MKRMRVYENVQRSCKIKKMSDKDNRDFFPREVEINSLDDFIQAISERASDEKTLIRSQINYLNREKERLIKLEKALQSSGGHSLVHYAPPYVLLLSLKLFNQDDLHLLNLLYDVMTKEAPEDILAKFKGKATLPLFKAIFKIGESNLEKRKEISQGFIDLLTEGSYHFSQTDLVDFANLLERFTSDTEEAVLYKILKEKIGTLPYGLLIGTEVTQQEYVDSLYDSASKGFHFDETLTYEDLSLLKGLSSLSEAQSFLLRLERHVDSLIAALEELIELPEDNSSNSLKNSSNGENGKDNGNDGNERNGGGCGSNASGGVASSANPKKAGKVGCTFLYRGQYNPKYKPIPSVFRDNFYEHESDFYHEIKVRCPDDFHNPISSHLDTLVHMQHYSCPTRLLDITTNPLAALYFACRNYGCEDCSFNDEGRVFLYCAYPHNSTSEKKMLEETLKETSDIKDKDLDLKLEIVSTLPVIDKLPRLNYSDSDKVLMLSCLPVLSYIEQKALLIAIDKAVNEAVVDKEHSARFEVSKDNNYGKKTYVNSVVEKLYHEIKREIPAFQRRINPNDLLNPLFVQPYRNNRRILKQDGAFIISGLSQNKVEAEEKIGHLCYTVFKIRNKDEILRQLDQIGINEAFLFPEVDNVSRYLVDKYTGKREYRL